MAKEEYALPHSVCHPMGGGECCRGAEVAPGRHGGILAFLLFSLLASGCTPPDHPKRLPGAVPSAVVSTLGLETMRTLSPGAGLAFFELRSKEGPWAVYLLRVDLGECDLGFRVLPAPKEEGMKGGRSRVTDLFHLQEGKVLAAVNGDFFTPEGISVGTEVVEGVIRRIRNRPAFAWKPGERPWMGDPHTEGDTALVLGWRVHRTNPDGVSQVLGGFPLLLKDGRRVGDLHLEDLPSFSAARHPRTAVGYDVAGSFFWIAVVDGRQPGYSDGMTLPELASLFEGLGATEAVNLDGGGSTVMVLRGIRVTRPSDAEGERPVVNALGVVRDPAYCRVERGG